MADSGAPPLPSLRTTGNMRDNWDRFQDHFEHWSIMQGWRDEGAAKPHRELAALCIAMDEEARQKLKYDVQMTDEERKVPATVMAKMRALYNPCKNVIFERFLFNSATQKPTETVSAFITRLRELAATCEYGNLQDSLIRDRLVVGIADKTVQKKLFSNAQLTLTQAIADAITSEATDKQNAQVGN